MRKNEHLGALVRINALQIATGDFEKAEEILKWAYETISSQIIESNNEDDDEEDIDKKTDEFIELYLTPDDSITKLDARRFAKEYIYGRRKSINYTKVKRHIRSMKYSDFLQTVYWKGVALFVKERDGNTCSICGAQRRLVAHHTNYENHGDEIHHLDDIQCVCKNCHNRIHGKQEEEYLTPKAIISLLDYMKSGRKYKHSELVHFLVRGGLGESNAKRYVRVATKKGFIGKNDGTYTKHISTDGNLHQGL